MSRGPSHPCRHVTRGGRSLWREQLHWSFSELSVTVAGSETVHRASAGGRIFVCTRCGERREVTLRRTV